MQWCLARSGMLVAGCCYCQNLNSVQAVINLMCAVLLVGQQCDGQQILKVKMCKYITLDCVLSKNLQGFLG